MELDIFQQSIDLHKKYRGKLEIHSKVPLENRRDLSLAYTPGVGRVVEQIAQSPELAKQYTGKGNSVAVITDGSAILGLGNLGPLAALPVMEGKAILFKEFAGIDAYPICLATQDTASIIQTVKLLAPSFGGINLEDIAAPRCFEIEQRLKEELDIPVMHDDQQGTAVVVLAGIINALKLRGDDKTSVRIVINGAGAAGIAISKLLLYYGFNQLTLVDRDGIIYQDRENLEPEKSKIAAVTNLEGRQGQLPDALNKADIFIGVSRGNILTSDLVRLMNDKPIIFALANPIPEIMPDLAKQAGAFIVATGRSDFPNQANNVLVFPGIFRGALDNNIKEISAEILVKAAGNLAGYVSDLSVDKILPDPLDKNVAKVVAQAFTSSK
jgi:malate dehydrogenase (oxaloacetate-decarboxylating)